MEQQLAYFFRRIERDARISVTHIGIFVSLLQYWKQQGYPSPLVIYCRDILPVAKISSSTTYHKCVRDLSDFGYLKYLASFKRNRGSQIFFLGEGEPQ